MTIWHGPSVSWPRDATLPALLRTAAEAAPDAAALIEAETGRTLTYRDLLELVNSMRAGLAARGLAPGGRLAAVARNSVDFVALALAAQDLGAAVSGLNPATPPEELVRAFAHIGAATMVADAPALEGARAAADRLGIGAVAGFDDIRADGGSGPAETDP